MKLSFIGVSLRNFMSYGNAETTISLQREGATLIEGRNLDDTADGVGANGVGKSTLINAIVYACYGKALSDTNLDKLVNIINGKNCVVGISFKKGADKYDITRYRKVKAGSEGTYITIFKNDDYDNDLAKGTLPESNAFIEEHIIGMSYDLFKQIVIFDADSTSFFREKAATQRTMVEDLFQLSLLTEKANLLKEANKDVTSEIKIQENTIEHLEQAAESYQDQLNSARSRLVKWERTHKTEVDDLRSTLEELQSIDIEAERVLFDQISSIEKQLIEMKSKESELKLQLSEAEKVLGSTETAIAVHNRSIKTINKELSRLESELERILGEIETINNNTCPTCHQSLPNADDLRTEAEQRKDTVDAELTDIRSEYDTHVCEVAKLKSDVLPPQQDGYNTIEAQVADVIAEIRGLKKTIPSTEFDSVDDLMAVEKQVELTQEKLEAKIASENPHIEALDEIEAKEVDTPNYHKINELNKILDHQKVLLKLLTDKKSFIRKTLINKRLPALNDRLKYYVTSFGLPFRVEFQSDLTAKVMRFGKIMDYGNLSGGQRARLNLAVAMSFRDMLERIHFGVDLCVFDEVLDRGLDDVGVMVITNHLIEKAKEGGCMFVITHKNDVASKFEQRLVVTMKNGFSFIDDNLDEDLID